MAAPSESDTTAAKKYVDYDEYVDYQIEKARSHIKATDIFTTLTTLVAAFVGYLLVFVICDQWLLADGFSDWARTALLSVVVLGIGATLVRNVAIPVIRRVHPLYAARMIEKSDPKLQSNLLNFVDLQEASDSSAAPSVVRAMQKRAAVELSNIDVDEAIDRRPLLRVAYALLAVVVVSALYIVFSPKDPFTSVRRALFPTSSIAVATETTIGEVTPGDDRVPARTKLTIEADVRGPHADRAQILVTTSDHKEVNQPVEMRRVDPDLPRYRGVLNGENGRGLLQSLTYAIVAGDARTRDFHIEVVQPPSARVDDVHLAFPTYMQFEERTTPGGNIDGWEGATVTVRATANLPVKSATVVMIDSEDPHAKGEEIAMQVTDGTKLSAKWKLEFRSDGTCPHFYYLQVKTAKGEVDPEPTVHPLRIRPDQRPEVALISPAGDLTGEKARAANAKIPLLIQAADPDFLLRSIRLKAERNGEEIVNEPLFENRDLGQALRGSHDWNLGQIRPPLRPGETIQFWIEARDNKQPTANRAVTPRVNLEIRPEKSADQVQMDLAAEKQQQADQLARADETKNDGGSEPQPRKDDPEGEKNQPPNRPAPNASPRRDEPPPVENERNKNEPKGEPKTEPGSGENRKRQPQPPGDDPQKTLERLLQKQQAEEQPKPEVEPTKDRQEEQKSSDDSKQEQGERGSQKKKSAGDRGAGKSADQDEGGKDSAAQKKPSHKKEDGGSDRNPQPGEGKRQEDSAAKKKDKAGESNSKDDKAGDGGHRDAKDASKPAQDKSADPAGKETPDKNSSDRKSPEEKSSEEKSTAEKSTAEKSPTKGTDEKPVGENKTGDKDAGDQRGKEGPKDSEQSPEKASDNADASGSKDRDNEKPGPASPDDPDKPKGDSPKSDANKPPTDPGQPSSDGDGNDKDAQQGGDSDKGKKTESNSKDGDAKAGDADQPDKSPDSKSPSRDKKSDADDVNGEQEPADDAQGAKKKKGAVKDSKEATGSDEEDPDAVRKNDVERKPGSKPGATKPSERKDADAQKPGERRKEKAGNNSATDDAKKTKRAADGKKDVEDPGANDDPASKKSDRDQPAETEKQPGESPELGNQDEKGEGRKKGQKSDQAQGGEKGKSGASDQGESGSNNEGAGDQGDQPGDSEKSKGKTGKSGQESGKGSATKPSDKGSQSKPGDQGKPGNKGGQGDGSESGKGEGESSKTAGKGEKGKPGDKSSSKSGSSSPSQSGKPSGGQSSSSEGGGVDGSPSGDDAPQDGDGTGDGKGLGQQGAGGDSVPSAEEEQARLDYAKKATNLLLKRLKDQLSRGEIDQKMLDEMGWKDAGDVAKFTQFLESNLNNASDETKRLQFEEMLKSMRLGNETTQRKGGEGRERRVESVDRRTAPPPPEYRQQWEDYNKRIGSKRDAVGTKPAPSGKK